jgi:hypothetical protein
VVRRTPLLWLAILSAGCSDITGTGGAPDNRPIPPGTFLPITDMGARTYLGFGGGLYPDAQNVMPQVHAVRGREASARIRPRTSTGTVSASGRYVLLSVGMSNTTQEFTSFQTVAAGDAQVNHSTLTLIDGAAGGRTAEFWMSAASSDYDRVRDTRLIPAGLGEAQVQIVWLKVANPGPTVRLPAANADAFRLLEQMGAIVRALKVRYPNMQQVFVSSRIYAGFASTTLNPEPYAFESGLAVKWLIEAQITQMRDGTVHPRAGDLDSRTVAPWIAWGPYLWADGTTARSDGFTWTVADFATDGTHPSNAGRAKVAQQLVTFLKASEQSRCWFLAGQSC